KNSVDASAPTPAAEIWTIRKGMSFVASTRRATVVTWMAARPSRAPSCSAPAAFTTTSTLPSSTRHSLTEMVGISRINHVAFASAASAARFDRPTPTTSNPAFAKARMHALPMSPYPPKTMALRIEAPIDTRCSSISLSVLSWAVRLKRAWAAPSNLPGRPVHSHLIFERLQWGRLLRIRFWPMDEQAAVHLTTHQCRSRAGAAAPEAVECNYGSARRLAISVNSSVCRVPHSQSWTRACARLLPKLVSEYSTL